MKLLLMGDQQPTGFGTVTTDLGRGLIDGGVDMRFLFFNETTEALPEPFGSRTATLGSPSGWLDALETRRRLEGMTTGDLFDGWVPDAALMLGDMGSIIESRILEILPAGFPAYHYVPVEGTGLPPSWRAIWSRLRPIAMSEWGATELERLLGYRPPVIYHGVDTVMFRPVSERLIAWRGPNEALQLRTKADCKRAFGFPADAFVILRTDQNVVRKGYFDLMWSIAPVLSRHSEALFVMHARTRDFGGDLDDMRSHFGPVAERIVPLRLKERFRDIPREVLVALYNAADLYVSNSCEGFGLTIAEAMACGVPTIGLDWSAVPEVIGDAGIRVPLGRTYPNVYAHLWGLASVDGMTGAIESLMASRKRRRELAMLGPLRIRAKFQWAPVARQFADVIESGLREKVAA